jgi:Spy/CpxP family protein refolding chaperone
MKKLGIVLLVVVFAGFFATSTFAQKGESCDGQGFNACNGEKCKGIGNKLLRGIKLEDEQREKIKAIREKFKDQMKESMKALEQARKAFRIAAMNPDSDESKLKSLSSAVAEKMVAKVQMRRKMIKEMKTILTDEQKTKLQDNLKKMAERTKEKCGRERKKSGKGRRGKKGKGRGRNRHHNGINSKED